ncbi:MAG: Inosine-5'-monophosphate dehydrogenase [Methanosaeta sp. PtaU1.Bin028]|nr:MAG: Inosine-5'-monophosphate dehydrogenase [Methanosaeta sp. PtaU1.Bin028]
MKRESAGLTNTQCFRTEEYVLLEHGDRLGEVVVAYETYGKLNRDRSNAVLVCHALSGDAHAGGWHKGQEKPGWWDIIIGPGKALDTDRLFVICSNVLGGCKGTTGPSSIKPGTGKPYGLEFPIITIKDMVDVQRRLVDSLGIRQLFAVVGGSFGGMQVLQWTVSYPDMVRLAVPIATSARSSPQQIAFNEVGRRAITSDLDWNGGDYYGRDTPARGLSLARMIGHITYLSDESMHQKFGRRLQDKVEYGFDLSSSDFQVESYLRYHGDAFVKRFDANSYLYITKAIDYFDLTRKGTLSLAEAFRGVSARFLVISISSDWLYPSYQSEEIVGALIANDIDVRHCEISSNWGHDAFLLESGQMNYAIGNFLTPASVGDVMVKDVVTISLGAGVEDAAGIMMKSGVTHLPVIAGDKALSGIVTAWDISKAVAMKYSRLEEIMTRNVVTARQEDPIERAAGDMNRHNISALPVVDESGKVVGMITSDGVSRLVGMCR